MPKTRKNFLSYDLPNSESKRDEARKILSSVFENLGGGELNALYKPEAPTPSTVLKHTILPFDQIGKVPLQPMTPVPTALASMEKFPGEDKIQINTKKPIKVVFKDDSGQFPPEQLPGEIQENASVVDDKVIIPIDFHSESSEDSDKEDSKDYDFLSSAPPLDLSEDPFKEDSPNKQLTDLVTARAQGMMPSVVAVSGQPLPTDMVRIPKPSSPKKFTRDAVRSIEEDPSGLSIVDMDMDIGTAMLARK